VLASVFPQTTEHRIFSGGGDSGALMRSIDWSSTSVGDVAAWPQSLRTTLSILLDNAFGMAVAWGADFTFFFNDAYRPILGSTKYPGAMGRPIMETFPEIWHIIGPMFADVMAGKSFGWDDWMLPLDRHGFTEECFFTFSYSPIRDESGGVGGVLVTVSEITNRVLGERRMRVLREIAARTPDAQSEEDACAIAAKALAQDPSDIPFALVYLVDAGGTTARLAASTRDLDHAPSHLELDDDSLWPLAEVVKSGSARLVEGLDRQAIEHSDEFGAARVRQAVVLPIARHGDGRPAGALVAGLSPRLLFDESYRGFLDLVASEIAAAVANVRAFRQAKERADALAEIDRAKTLFFSNVSHELRTPLTLILGPIEARLKRESLAAEERDSLAVAHRNALRLLKLVNTLLEFSRIEAGRIDVSYEPTDLASFTADLAGVFRSAIAAAGLEFHVHCEPLPEPVYVDREMWEKIVLNLLSNALKFTFEGEIEIALSAAGTGVELRVRDTGVGIPAAELPNMFARFHRVRGARSRSHEGTGIGLALVKELVRLHGGRVDVESSEGAGTTFTVEIPLGRAHLPPERVGGARTLTPATIGPAPYLQEIEQWIPRQRPQAPAAARETIFGHVLFVDDNADMRDYVSRLLEPQWSVETAENGARALERIRARKPDLVLADVMMPVMNGFELLRTIREESSLADLPVILLSARAGEEAKVEGLGAGADDYLIKPFSAVELIARVRANLGLARFRNEALERERGLHGALETANRLLRDILDSITDAFTFVDRQWIIRMVNPQAEKILGARASELVGANLWETFSELAGSHFEAACRKAMAEGISQRVEEHFAALQKWLEVNVDPSGDGLTFLYRDVTDRVRTAETLRESELRHRRLAAELEIANRAKDEFLTTLSHELRTPMTATLGWASMLRMGTLEESNWKQAAEAIEQSTRAQAKLIDDILDVSRISTGKLLLDLAPASLEEITETAVATIRQLADAKSQSIETHIEKLHGCVIADGDRLGQVIRNLLSNAVKFTPRGGQIRIDVGEAGPSTARVRVSDSGDGINAEFLPFVFDRFRQAESGLRRIHGGLGLGLSIVKDLTELHGGTVTAESEGAGKGATFTLTLPLVKRDTLPEVTRHSNDHVGGLDGIPVLIVEDDPSTRVMLQTALSRFGAAVLTASSADEAMRIILDGRRCVIVSDIAMPEEDGYAFIGRLRSAEKDESHLPIIALTANARAEDRDHALRAGFDSFLAKPIDIRELADEIHRLAHARALTG
jgi:PAS domain S-box-containing protein